MTVSLLCLALVLGVGCTSGDRLIKAPADANISTSPEDGSREDNYRNAEMQRIKESLDKQELIRVTASFSRYLDQDELRAILGDVSLSRIDTVVVRLANVQGGVVQRVRLDSTSGEVGDLIPFVVREFERYGSLGTDLVESARALRNSDVLVFAVSFEASPKSVLDWWGSHSEMIRFVHVSDSRLDRRVPSFEPGAPL